MMYFFLYMISAIEISEFFVDSNFDRIFHYIHISRDHAIIYISIYINLLIHFQEIYAT